MTQIKPRFEAKKMSLDEAINMSMTPEAWKAYIEFHEQKITRRDD